MHHWMNLPPLRCLKLRENHGQQFSSIPWSYFLWRLFHFCRVTQVRCCRMTEIDRIADQLSRGFDGDAWHGDPLLKILDDVTAEQAAAHPVKDGHSIWEIVNHISAWRPAIVTRLSGKPAELTGNGDWPPVTDNSETAWRNCLSDLRQRHEALMKAVRVFPENKLSENAPNRDHSFYVLLHGMVQHDLYHAGQIAILKKAAR
jgi:uncharacterized damage-inducible protein DinB